MSKIGLIGLGRMGAPLCNNLVAAGYEVVAHDIDPGRRETALARGATWSPSPAAAAAEADVLLTVVPGPSDVAAVMDDRVVDALAPGATWIDMTSNSPTQSAPVRERVLKRGVDVLEAPMGGGPKDAEAGRLRLFVGGDPALLARHRQVLEAVADPDRIVHVGGHGAGYTAKLLVNLLWFGQAVATAEALLVGSRMGIDVGVLRDVLADSPASSAFIRTDLSALFAGDYLTSFGLDHIEEQLAMVVSLARDNSTPHTVTESVRRLYAQAGQHFGPADGELLAVALLEEQAGLLLRTPPTGGEDGTLALPGPELP
ncbi:NAD(P)-dependent oxidoreductase [Streptomyces sp. NPDC004680]|uniref:NAD(P)-dependent oxidoreductase n=1 Tax=Streptomyces sp. NPDC004680 TaxID=3154287 RepID=UPI0033ADB25E